MASCKMLEETARFKLVFYKNIFFGEGEYCVSEEEKHRTSLSKSTEVLPRKYGGLHQRSPMFLFSESIAHTEGWLRK